jgi:NAD(P)H-dependent FMN reductase
MNNRQTDLGQALKIGIIVGSTRSGRKGKSVGEWAYDIARRRADADFELVGVRYGIIGPTLPGILAELEGIEPVGVAEAEKLAAAQIQGAH